MLTGGATCLWEHTLVFPFVGLGQGLGATYVQSLAMQVLLLVSKQVLDAWPGVKRRFLHRVREGLMITSDYSGWCFAEYGVASVLNALSQLHYRVTESDDEMEDQWKSRAIFHSANDNDENVLQGLDAMSWQ